jgi:hypothetical protein
MIIVTTATLFKGSFNKGLLLINLEAEQCKETYDRIYDLSIADNVVTKHRKVSEVITAWSHEFKPMKSSGCRNDTGK